MLLLVLILVLIAFALLVVALLTGSVLWAWVSVGVSVAAAAVLLVDWLQRRSAVKAGAEAGDAPPVPAAEPVPPPHALVGEPAVEPATEVFPVVRSDGPGVGASGPDLFGGAAGDGRDERPDARETVVMSGFPPPGSAGQPPGAHGGIGPHEPISSRSVTPDGDRPPASEHARQPEAAPEFGREGAAPGDHDPEETIRTVGAGRGPVGRDETPVGAAPPRGTGATAGPPAGPPLRDQLPPLGPDGAPPEEPRDAEAAGLVATLEDEVLVVDELPRYHLAGCRSLSTAVIPLPAREAVELGFTPCAWCTPDRTLSGRHRAPAR